MYDDLFIEMLDVFFNSILYLRDVYPSGIFRRRRIYSTAIYASIYPPLNDYLKKVLKAASELKSQQKLRKVELVIFREEFTIFDDDADEQILEKFVFQIEENDNRRPDKMDLGDYLMEYEEQVRQALLRINFVMKNMKPLDGSECGFRIELETTQDAFVDLVNKSNSQPEVRIHYYHLV